MNSDLIEKVIELLISVNTPNSGAWLTGLNWNIALGVVKGYKENTISITIMEKAL